MGSTASRQYKLKVPSWLEDKWILTKRALIEIGRSFGNSTSVAAVQFSPSEENCTHTHNMRVSEDLRREMGKRGGGDSPRDDDEEEKMWWQPGIRKRHLSVGSVVRERERKEAFSSVSFRSEIPSSFRAVKLLSSSCDSNIPSIVFRQGRETMLLRIEVALLFDNLQRPSHLVLIFIHGR